MPLDSDRPDAAQGSGDPQPDPVDTQSTEDSRAESADAPSAASTDGAAEAASTDGAAGAASTDGATDGGADRPRRSWRDRARGAGHRMAALRRSKVAWAVAAVLLVLLISWERCGVRGCPSVSRLASYLPG
ncbi:MAG TPA: hypothetical protein VMM79_20215, partial [Longimicrobiales bacterium]|nr:hypothetical protein [Longimicrobiales bacterium]